MNTMVKILPVPWGKAVFVLRQIRMIDSVKYHITVGGEDGTLHHFSMQQKGQGWRIVPAPQVPRWIQDAEQELSLEILIHHL